MQDHFLRQFIYDAWANREEVERLAACDPPPAPALKLLAHVLGTQQVWLERLTGESAGAAVWPEWDIAQCRGVLETLPSRWEAFVRDSDFHREINYKTSKGEPFRNTIGDILTHVLYHGAYHRGQIASRMRDGGEMPAATDYIIAARSGKL
jgi:uncharacterized damage-inducible protein DinB